MLLTVLFGVVELGMSVDPHTLPTDSDVSSKQARVIHTQVRQTEHCYYIMLQCNLPVSSCGSFTGALTKVTGVTASANGWDTRTEGNGCAPSGCLPENTLDDSIEPVSRWSCSAAFSEIAVSELTLFFDAPQDIMEIRMALWKGDRRLRSVNVLVDGELITTLDARGETEEYEAYELNAIQTTVVLQSDGTEDNGWLSITGVR